APALAARPASPPAPSVPSISPRTPARSTSATCAGVIRSARKSAPRTPSCTATPIGAASTGCGATRRCRCRECADMGWQRKVLRVDLSAGSITTEPLNMAWANEYIGERGLATRYLVDNMDPAADPLSPENTLIFATGPLSGTLVSTSGRYCVVTKGPLTGAIACSNSGGKFGVELKFCGYDMLIVKGRSERPVYLLVEDDDVALMPADDLWGRTVWDTEETIKERHKSEDMKVASIGVAGERGVYYACIVNDLHRAAGRSGVGAVMGSKNLKAIAARGSKGVRVKDPARIMRVVEQKNKKLFEDRSRRAL